MCGGAFLQRLGRQKHVLDIAIRKMELLQQQIFRTRDEGRIEMWGRVARRLMMQENERAIREYEERRYVLGVCG